MGMFHMHGRCVNHYSKEPQLKYKDPHRHTRDVVSSLSLFAFHMVTFPVLLAGLAYVMSFIDVHASTIVLYCFVSCMRDHFNELLVVSCYRKWLLP